MFVMIPTGSDAQFRLGADDVDRLVKGDRLRVSYEYEQYVVRGKGYAIICPRGIGQSLWSLAGLPWRIGKTLA